MKNKNIQSQVNFPGSYKEEFTLIHQTSKTGGCTAGFRDQHLLRGSLESNDRKIRWCVRQTLNQWTKLYSGNQVTDREIGISPGN